MSGNIIFEYKAIEIFLVLELDIIKVKLVLIMRASKGDNDEITSQSEDNYNNYHYSQRVKYLPSGSHLVINKKGD